MVKEDGLGDFDGGIDEEDEYDEDAPDFGEEF